MIKFLFLMLHKAPDVAFFAPRSSRQRAFTLIELLVVIAILAFMASTLLPAFGNAREKAKQATCVNNLKRLGAALMMYAHDNEGWLPAHCWGDDGNYSYSYWTNKLAVYVPTVFNNEQYGASNTGVWQCPSSPDGSSASYGTNYWDLMGKNFTTNLSKITRPSEVLMIADAMDTRPIFSAGRNMGTNCIWNPIYAPGYGYPWDTGSFTLANWHNGGGNVCFVDGHVEWIKYEDAKNNKNDLFGCTK